MWNDASVDCTPSFPTDSRSQHTNVDGRVRLKKKSQKNESFSIFEISLLCFFFTDVDVKVVLLFRSPSAMDWIGPLFTFPAWHYERTIESDNERVCDRRKTLKQTSFLALMMVLTFLKSSCSEAIILKDIRVLLVVGKNWPFKVGNCWKKKCRLRHIRRRNFHWKSLLRAKFRTPVSSLKGIG